MNLGLVSQVELREDSNLLEILSDGAAMSSLSGKAKCFLAMNFP